MPSALDVFDYCQTIGISLCLIITIPLACYLYSKLLLSRPFSESYTYKLIVFNGTTELLSSVMYLVVFQLTSFSFMRGFYHSVQNFGLATILATSYHVLACLALHSSLFIALNRTKKVLFLHRDDTEFIFSLLSIFLSMVFTLPAILHFCFTTSEYIEIKIGNESILFPKTFGTENIFKHIYVYTNAVVSLATFLVNILLCVLINRERKFNNIFEMKKFHVEKGLAIMSIISYATYMMYFINSLISTQLGVLFCGYAQWLFQGIKSMTPLWCLIAFVPSVRRLVHKEGRSKTVASTQASAIALFNLLQMFLIIDKREASPLVDPSPSTVTIKCQAGRWMKWDGFDGWRMYGIRNATCAS